MTKASPNPLRRMAAKWAVIVALLLSLSVVGAMGVSADSGPRTLTYLLGTGFICDLDPSACPDVAMAKNGDTVEIMGEGTISIHPKAATGGGTFVHKKANGDVIGSGTWMALELLSFHSYGSGAAQGFPPETEGGRAHIRVQLSGVGPEGPVTLNGVLRVTCLLGDKIPKGAIEGVTLNVQDLINFNKEVSGFTLFID